MSAPARAYSRFAAAGGVAGLAVQLVLLLQGGRLLGYDPLGDVFDAQAHAFLDGRWDIPAEVIKIEGFLVDGRTYTYFGPVPALLRLPIAAVTDAFDGRLTRLSLLAATAVAAVFATRIAWRARVLVAGSAAPVRTAEGIVVGAWVFTIAGASSLTFLASRPSVFHEAIAWGVAFALAGLDAVARWDERRTRLALAAAVVAVTAALLTRASVGAAPALAFAAVLARDLVRDRRVLRSIALGAVLLVPAGSYVAVNWAKFGTLVTVPFEAHQVSIVDEHRRAVLAANDGTIQGPQFLPTTALHYVRPDALGLDGQFPWIDFPRRALVVGDVLMDKVDVASSVPSSMPALTIAAVVGIAVTVRGRRRVDRLVPLVAGAAACLVVTLAIGFIAQRYTADAVPLLVVASAPAIGAVSIHPLRPAVAGVAASAVGASLAITCALTIQFQQHYGFLTPPHLRATLAARQLDLPGATPQVVRVRGDLPDEVAADRTFAVIGDCDGVYRSDGQAWQPVERTPATGEFGLRILPELDVGHASPLVAGIELVRVSPTEVAFRHGDRASAPVAAHDAEIDVTVIADARLGFVEVRDDGELLLDDYYFPEDGPAVVHHDRFDGEITVEPYETPVCDALAGRSS